MHRLIKLRLIISLAKSGYSMGHAGSQQAAWGGWGLDSCQQGCALGVGSERPGSYPRAPRAEATLFVSVLSGPQSQGPGQRTEALRNS